MNTSPMQIPSRAARPLWLLLLLGAMLLVAACAPGGTPNTTSNTAAQASPTSASAATPTQTPGTTAKTGCPAATQEVNWSPEPGAIFTTKQSSSINVKVGETFEISLPMGHVWKMAPLASSILKLDTPAGYGDAATQSCIWHFTTQASGQTSLEYTMQALCQPGTVCPAYITVVDMTVKASA
jgi:hypothetical protein